MKKLSGKLLLCLAVTAALYALDDDPLANQDTWLLTISRAF